MITSLQHVYPSLFLPFPTSILGHGVAKKKMPQSFSSLLNTFLFSTRGEDLIEQCTFLAEEAFVAKTVLIILGVKELVQVKILSCDAALTC
ncbi:hypothetical protein E2542_SST22993 [Spatholobus suberectus]|nr:hypothetical protein E2542_SST22993 [Spatholobus suberectus]